MKYHVMPFLTQTECKTFMDFYDKQPAEKIVNDYVTCTGQIINRDQDVLSITDSEDLYGYFLDKLKGTHPEICKAIKLTDSTLARFYLYWCKGYGIPSTEFSSENNKIKIYELFLSKYGVGKYCSPHQDDKRMGRMFTEWYWLKNNIPERLWHKHPRLYTVSITLNSEYEGGELYIYDDNDEPVKIESNPGDIVVMEPERLHEVTKVTAGNRYAIISWAYLDHDSFVPAGSVDNIFDLSEQQEEFD